MIRERSGLQAGTEMFHDSAGDAVARGLRNVRTMARAPLLSLSLAFLLAGPGDARATVLAEVPLDDMIYDSDGIVVGDVLHVGVQMAVREDGRLEPWTVTTLRVDRWLKNGSGSGVGADRVTIWERGGVWQGGGMRIDGTPEYRAGERVLVFLWNDPLGRTRTYGMVQGRFVVRAGVPGVATTVERDVSAVGFAQWSSAGMTVTHLPATTMPLDAMVARIHRVLALMGEAP